MIFLFHTEESFNKPRSIIKFSMLIFGLLFVHSSCNFAATIPVVVNNTSAYVIVLPVEATATERKAALVLQHYFQLATKVKLPVKDEKTVGKSPAFYIGSTNLSNRFKTNLKGEGFAIASDTKNIALFGARGQSTLYAVYSFIEAFLGGQKLNQSPATVAELVHFNFPSFYKKIENPSFDYRQVHFAFENDEEYLAWHKLHKLDDLWGIWGHSYFKLLPPKDYFNQHPEYFSEVKGKRQAIQLCPTNPNVANIIIQKLKKEMAQKDWAEYWSISANDEIEFCTCKTCSQINEKEQSNGAAHLYLVNKIASAFPDKKFTSLAYLHTIKPPLQLKPASNVYIMLSSIDALRSKPLRTEPTAAAFRNYLKKWSLLTSNIFVWDYCTQFTNYLAPFPNFFNYLDDAKFFKEQGVKGVFEQGSGNTLSDFDALKSYVWSKLLWNANSTNEEWIANFCKAYYKSAAPFIQAYYELIQKNITQYQRSLDIYGNPINEYNTYLSPEYLDTYSTLLDQAEAKVEDYPHLLKRVQAVRLSLEYTVLQQSKFYGIEKHGYLIKTDKGYEVKEGWIDRVERFVSLSKSLQVNEFAEGKYSPDEYLDEWKKIVTTPYQHNLALNATVQLKNEFAPEYPAKKERTLTDGMYGFDDFSYNWLCFYGKNLEATITLPEAVQAKTIQTHFLLDARHWIFAPTNVEIWISENGKDFQSLGSKPTQQNIDEEQYQIQKEKFEWKFSSQKVKSIKIIAKVPTTLPAWRYRANRLPMIACDEIYLH